MKIDGNYLVWQRKLIAFRLILTATDRDMHAAKSNVIYSLRKIE